MHNALLVRWAGGWREVTDTASITANGRSEALLGLGAVNSVGEVDRIAGQQLDIFANPRTEISADYRPVAETGLPYLAFNVGDSVLVPDLDGTPVREQVTSMTVSEDADGQVSFAPDLKDVILTREERWEQALKKMADGTMRGQSSVAQPVAGGAPLPAVAPPGAAAVIGCPHAQIRGVISSMDQGGWEGTQPDLYWQSAAADALFTLVDDGPYGYAFRVTKSCDLFIHAIADLYSITPYNDTADLDFQVGFYASLESGTTSTINGENWWETWNLRGRGSFPVKQYTVYTPSVAASALYHIEVTAGEYVDVWAIFVNHFATIDAVYWSFSITALETATAREIPTVPQS